MKKFLSILLMVAVSVFLFACFTEALGQDPSHPTVGAKKKDTAQPLIRNVIQGRPSGSATSMPPPSHQAQPPGESTDVKSAQPVEKADIEGSPVAEDIQERKVVLAEVKFYSHCGVSCLVLASPVSVSGVTLDYLMPYHAADSSLCHDLYAIRGARFFDSNGNTMDPPPVTLILDYRTEAYGDRCEGQRLGAKIIDYEW